MAKAIETISAGDLYYTPIPQRENEMIVENMIPQGLTILAGPPKAGKSWLILDLGIAVASGRPILGRQTLGCGVLYFALEDRAASLQKRLQAIEQEEPPDNLYLATTCPPLGQELYDSLHEYLKIHPDIRLIIIDTLQMIRRGDGGNSVYNQYGRDTDDLNGLKRFADNRNLAIVVVHHVTKRIDPDDPVNDIRGSSGMSATPDSILILRRQRVEAQGELLCVSRSFPQWKMRLRLVHLRWQVQEVIAEEEMAREAVPDAMYRIVDLIRIRGRWEGTMTQMMAEIGETRMPSNVLSRKLTRCMGSVFEPAHIEVRMHRTSRERRYTFRYHPPQEEAKVTTGDEMPQREISSLSSLPSSSSQTDAEYREHALQQAREILLGN